MPSKDLLRFPFCFLSLNSSIARPFDSSGVGGFLGISPLFASFPSRPTRYLCLGLRPHITNHPTQTKSPDSMQVTQLLYSNIVQQNSTKLMPHNMLVIVYGQFFGQYRKIFLVNTAKYFWSIQQNILGQYSKGVLVITGTYFWSIQQNIFV